MRSDTLLDLARIERSFAYDRASCEITGDCVVVGLPGDEPWYDLSSAETPVTEEVAYLESRGLLERHEAHPQWVRVRDEDQPLPVKVVLQ